MISSRTRILRMLIALDQFLFCVISLGKYHPDITLSAQAYVWHINKKRHWPCKLIDILFYPIEKNHCREAWFSEMQRPV